MQYGETYKVHGEGTRRDLRTECETYCFHRLLKSMFRIENEDNYNGM